jgi:hypothetical protein
MVLNIIVGFIIPWIIALVFIRERKILFLITPFACTVSLCINDLGFFFFWRLYPFNLYSLSALPYDFGLFCLYPCFGIYIIRKFRINPSLVLLVASILLTLSEGCGVLIGRVYYLNHWNIVATFFSYYISIIASYLFYKAMLHKNYI